MSYHRGGLLLTVAVSAVAIVPLTVLVLRDPSPPPRRTMQPRTTSVPLPTSILAINNRGELIEVDSARGKVLRTIAPHLDLWHGGESLAAPRTSEALVGSLRVPSTCGADFDPDSGSVGWIDLASGQTRAVDLASTALRNYSPAANADGTRVAFIEERCDNSTHLTIVDGHGSRLAVFDPPSIPGAVTHFGAVAGWDADGTHLVALLLTTVHPTTTESWVSLALPSDSGAVPDIQQITLDPNVLELLPLGLSGKWGAVIGGPERRSTARVVEFDIERGRVTRELVRWTQKDAIVQIAASDSSGDHILLLVTPNVEFGPERSVLVSTQPVLYRWNARDEHPKKLVAKIAFATWLPSPPELDHAAAAEADNLE